MANPFSGLENIGQSYLQGVQLANQRQAREEAIAQRQEEARVRERYYQDLVDQRREAATLASQDRDQALAMKFGKFLKRDKSGAIDIVELLFAAPMDIGAKATLKLCASDIIWN